MKGLRPALLSAVLLVFLALPAAAQGPPPAKVVTAPVTQGRIIPMGSFVGTVFFVRSSDLAAEVSGRVDKVDFEEGDRVRSGQALAKVDTDLLDKEIAAREAQHRQVISEHRKAEIDLGRAKELFASDVMPAEQYDTVFYREEELRHQEMSIRAEVERLKIQRSKSVIRAPFDGVVVKKSVAVGEWVGPGTVIATVADDSRVDVRVQVPQDVLPYLTPDAPVPVKSGGAEITGKFKAVIPSGDVRTRTVPVAIRLTGGNWVEGTEALVELPTGEARDSLIVSRDALLKLQGENTVYTVEEGKAVPVPVQVVGYAGTSVGVSSPRLSPEKVVVVKGNERLRPGQPVVPVGETEGAGKKP